MIRISRCFRRPGPLPSVLAPSPTMLRLTAVRQRLAQFFRNSIRWLLPRDLRLQRDLPCRLSALKLRRRASAKSRSKSRWLSAVPRFRWQNSWLQTKATVFDWTGISVSRLSSRSWQGFRLRRDCRRRSREHHRHPDQFHREESLRVTARRVELAVFENALSVLLFSDRPSGAMSSDPGGDDALDNLTITIHFNLYCQNQVY